MEAFLIFLAIIAIQMIAAYSKQKKEAQRKKQSKPVNIPRETAPIPDPFREIREMMGLPSAEEPEEPEEDLKKPVYAAPPEPEFKREGMAPVNLPFKSITDRKRNVSNESAHKEPVQTRSEIRKLNIRHAIDTNNLKQGILWTAILQEPRYRTKWKPITNR
jgi:hypothetical protein